MAPNTDDIVLFFDEDLEVPDAHIRVDLADAAQIKRALGTMTKLFAQSEYGVRFQVGTLDAQGEFSELEFPEADKPEPNMYDVCNSEFAFFYEIATKHPDLREDIFTFWQGTVRDEEPLAMDETVFGMSSLTALALVDRKYVRELTSFLEMQDLNHEVEQTDFLNMVWKKWPWNEDTMALALARLTLPSQHGMTHFAKLKGLDEYVKDPAVWKSMATFMIERLRNTHPGTVKFIIPGMINALFAEKDRELAQSNFERALAEKRVPTREELLTSAKS